MSKTTIPEQFVQRKRTVKNNTQVSEDTVYCCFSFRHLKTDCISRKDFNNHFKDAEHFQKVISSFIKVVLPKISELTTTELMGGGRFAQQFHFHKVGREKYGRIESILKAYSFNEERIKQFLDGEHIYQFIGNLEGHAEETRVICEYINGTLYVLFFDTNHHLYINRSKAGNSFDYSFCPFEPGNQCGNAYCCLAKEFLDTEKIEETFGYSFDFE